jgi:hypothetical protein
MSGVAGAEGGGDYAGCDSGLVVVVFEDGAG